MLISVALLMLTEASRPDITVSKICYISILFFCTGITIWYLNINILSPLNYLRKNFANRHPQIYHRLEATKGNRVDAAGAVISELAGMVLTLSENISNATGFIEAIEKGQLDAKYTGIHDDASGVNDPLAHALLNMRTQMLSISEQEKERAWATEGLAKFADILRTHAGEAAFYDIVLAQLIKYLSANQGGLYLLSEDEAGNRGFDLVAYYAYERKKYLNTRFDVREGLVGQCYLEKEVIYLTEIPDDYIKITSGAGHATPKCLILVPLKVNEEVQGVMEIASFSTFKQYQIDFLLRLGESMASAVSNLKITEKTRSLLEDSQMQAEQMRAQEEEMRQNMEELHATQEEMMRSEKVHLQEIERLQLLHEENMKEAELKALQLEQAKRETEDLMHEIQTSQEEISKNYQFLFQKFNDFNIESKFDQLTAIRSTKKRTIEDYFATIRSQIMTYSEDKMIVDAMRSFKKVFHDLAVPAVEAEELAMMKEKVRQYYENEFLPRLNANKEDYETIDKYWEEDPRTLLMQYRYIAGNPNETGKKHLLNTAGSDEYAKIHEIYHPIIRNFLLTFGYYDIFLIDSETGHLVYSVFKEVDYTTSLLTGPYKHTNFARVFREAASARKKEFIKLVDFEPYDPSYTEPASFIATPIYDGDTKIGVLVFQMPIGKINSIMTGDNKWKEDGLGQSGETYLVGEDYKMRSASRFLIEDPVGYFNELERIGYNENIIKRIKQLKTTTLLQDVKTEAVMNALRGTSGKKIVADYRGISVLSAYAKLNVQDVNWVICSDIDEEEVINSVSYLKNISSSGKETNSKIIDMPDATMSIAV